jgi:transcriptional regulator with XRE-family HTH domain
MNGQPQLGARLRRRREHRGEYQATVAGFCGISEDYLSKIERGKRVPSMDVLTRLASRYEVSVDELLSDTSPQQVTSATPVTIATAVANALTGRSTGRPTADPLELRRRVDALWQTWQTSRTRYSDAEPLLPGLIADTEQAVRAQRSTSDPIVRRHVLRTAADLYCLLRSYCRRTGRPDLALMVADRALRAAEDADDPLRIAIARWNIGHVLLGQKGAAGHAEDVARIAVDELHRAPSIPEHAAAEGALELVAVVAAAQTGRWWQARDVLAERAAPLGARTQEGSNIGYTCFGPANVGLHALSIEMLAGDAREGLRLAETARTTDLPRERRFTFTLEVAALYEILGEDTAVLVHLLEMEHLAPEDLVRSPVATAMVTSLLGRASPSYSKTVSDLAARLQLI